MALTQEQQAIFDAVIASLRTNSKTIEQLTPQTALGSNDWFELNGGRKVSYTVLRSLISSISSDDLDSLRTLIGKNVLKSVSFDVGEGTATLTIKSAGETITCNVPVAMQYGIAPLNGEGKIDNKYLPESARDVIVFDHIAEDVEIMMSSSGHYATDPGCSLVYNRTTESFVISVMEYGNTSYYANWSGADKCGQLGDAQGWYPYADRLYICRDDSGLYMKDISDNGLKKLSGSGSGISSTEIATSGEISAVADAVFGEDTEDNQ